MSGSVAIKQGSETDLLSAVANVGPIAVAVDGSSNAFRVSRHMHMCKLNKCSCCGSVAPIISSPTYLLLYLTSHDSK